MLRRRLCIACATAATVLAAVAVPAAGSGDAKRATKKVTVADDYFAPEKVKIDKGSKVKWIWDDDNTNTHNVVLGSTHPNGVDEDDFRSSSGAVGLVFKRKFTVKGKYGFICTYHRSVMKQTVKVTK